MSASVTDGRGPQEEQTVLWVGGFYSQCGACGHNADPYELDHTMRTMRGEGCGATFTHIASSYLGIGEDRLHEMRPDLATRTEAHS